MTTLLLLLLIFSALAMFTNLLLKSRRTCHRPPGPKGLPFIGNLHQVNISKPHIWVEELSRKYGSIIYLKFGRLPIIMISSADAAKKTLKHNDVAFAGRPYTYASWRFSYNHSDIICSLYTDYWRKMRKIVVTHLFNPQKLRSFRPIRYQEVAIMIARVSSMASSNDLINIGNVTSSCNNNILCRAAFGKRLEQSWIRFNEITSQFVAILYTTFLADCFVFGLINKICGATSKIEKILNDMDFFYQELIDEHLDPKKPDSMNDDILDLLIKLREDRAAEVQIDWNHVKATVMNIFIAGTDTTGVSLTWAMTALMKNPNKMKKLQEEIRSLVGKKGLIDEDDIEKLPYLKAVVKETLRLYPPVPFIPRETIEACVVDGYKIEAKTFVLVNIWAIGRDPEYWENADEFLPERFLNTAFDFKGQQFGFIPFGSGRRICPGVALAVANIEVALANLVYMFDWEIALGKTEEEIDTDVSMGLVMHKKNPLYLLAKPYT